MKKIPSLFMRNYDGDRLVRDEVVPGCEWVLRGEGVATRKFDGTCCLVRGGKLYKRYDVKKGRTPPSNFEPAQEPDATTGHWPGWVPVGDGPEDAYHREAMSMWDLEPNPSDFDGTYELIGPKIQGNPDGADMHSLVKHGAEPVGGFPRTFDEIKLAFQTFPGEGVVWHHPDGRMCKIKRKDFGYRDLAWKEEGR